jgi:TetR/AcrR family transcriptional repressor of nem operon
MNYQQKSDTEMKLLESGQFLFLTHGFHGTSIQDICEEANLTKGSFFHYFKNKKEFLVTVLNYYFDQLTQLTFTQEFYQKKDPDERNIGYIDFIIELAQTEFLYHGCLMGNITQELSSSDAEIQRIVTQLFDKWIAIIAQELIPSFEKHTINIIDPLNLAKYFLAVYEGSLLLSKGKKDKSTVVVNLKIFRQNILQIFSS